MAETEVRGPSGLSAFEGRWHLVREIRQIDGPDGHLTGEASFTRSGPGVLIMDEVGRLTMDGGPALQATRRYVWRAGSQGIEVSFEDNKPFHVIGLASLQPDAVHLCAPDRYEVAYDFTAWPRWRSVWQVEGPRKAYRMTSDYTRI